MVGNKQDIEKYLVFQDKEDEFYIFKKPLTKEQRTKCQNDTFYMCFDKISKKLGISSDEVKQNCLKALFGITKSKFGGVYYENANISRTRDLNKEQAILLIDSLVEFGKKLKMGEIVQSRMVRDLFYNN